jgi:hypothetical protein
MNSYMNTIVRLSIVAVAVSVCLNDRANAEMSMILSGDKASPIVSFELSGTSISEPGPSFTYLGHVFRLDDDSEPFPPEITNANVILGGYTIVDGGGTISNLTRNVTSPITAIGLQGRKLIPGFGVGFKPSLPLNAGDVVGWSGSGHIDLSISNLKFGDLTPGTYAGTAIIGGFSGSLTIVPEPSLSSLLVVCCIAGALRVRR